jgi:tRNA (guanine-N7-)-methyltransferase
MARRKLRQFAEMEALPNVLQHPENIAGTWHQHFGNQNPIILELGCGTGAYTLSLAKRYPEKNIIGVDIKGSRMWHGATSAHEEGVENAAFLRIVIENIANYFAENEVDEIWITFPDPHPREGKKRKRLTSERFFAEYRKILRKDGIVHLKTDNQDLFTFSLEEATAFGKQVIFSSNDIYHLPELPQDLDIKTTYEARYLAQGKSITYLKFTIH